MKLKDISSEEIIGKCLKEIEENDKEIKAYKTINGEGALKKAKEIDEKRDKEQLGKLAGIPMVIGDNISTKGIKTTANSKMLEGYIPPFNATVVERLLKEDAIILGKSNIREFGVGKSENPWGTAAAVVDNEGVIGIASDTEGEVLQSAAYYGIYGLKPSYGLISRYGLIGVASSLDHIGILGRDIKDMALVLEVIAGKDPKDSTSIEMEEVDYTTSLDVDIDGIKIGIPEGYIEEDILESLEKWKELGAIIDYISMPSLDYGIEAYEIISSGEFSSNMARYDGIGYGYRTKNYKNIEELYRNSRSESFGEEVKKKILFGNFVLSSTQYKDYYEKAQRIRAWVKSEFDNIFKDYDYILSPVSSLFTIGANLIGIPALSLPYKNKGIQLMTSAFNEEKLLGLGNFYEKTILKEDKIGGEK